MKFSPLLFALLVACGSTPITPAPIILTTTQYIVKLPPSQLLTLQPAPIVPNPDTSTQLHVSQYLINLYKDDNQCRNQLIGISQFFNSVKPK